MKFSIKKLPKSKIEILFEIPSKEFEDFIEKATFNLGNNLEIEGFRRGKIPKEILEKEIGKERILREAIEMAIKENYFKVIFERKFEPISQPEIEILSPTTFQENSFNRIKTTKSGGGLIFKASFSILPEIELADFKKIASGIKRKEIEVPEKEIEDAILWLQKSRAKFIFKNQPAQKGDFVEINFQSPQIEGGVKQKDSFILGQGQFVGGFEENLEGMNFGEEKEFSLKFPENHSKPDLAGKEINFKVKMNSIQKMELPEINDQFAKSLGKFENLVALKRSIKEGLEIEKEIAESQRIRQEILEKICRNSSLEVPEILIEAEKNRLLEDLKERVARILQISFNDYLNKIKKSEEEIRNSFSLEAEDKVKKFLLLREISKIERISVSEEEMKEKINQFLKNYPSEKLKELDLEKLKSYYEEEIRNEKTFQFLENLTK